MISSMDRVEEASGNWKTGEPRHLNLGADGMALPSLLRTARGYRALLTLQDML